jgi:hypothetical protein
LAVLFVAMEDGGGGRNRGRERVVIESALLAMEGHAAATPARALAKGCPSVGKEGGDSAWAAVRCFAIAKLGQNGALRWNRIKDW